MKVIATLVKAKDLKPGDLFHSKGPKYWETLMPLQHSVGEVVFLRTETPCPIDQVDEEVYRITVDHAKKSDAK